jgi:non-ribosomal peptide synthetase component F
MSSSTHADHVERIDTVFRRHVAAHPDKVAAWDPSGSSTYAELWEQAAGLADTLQAKGIGPGDPVGIFGVGDRESIVAMLGILIAGGHFVPVDPDCPAERIERMAALAGLSLVLLTARHRFPEAAGVDAWHVRDLVGRAAPAGRGVDTTGGTASPDGLAYVIFTSGSTGAPKAVGVSHGALTALCLRPGPLRRSPDDTVLVHTTLTFDPSVLEIWSPLLVGGSVLCAPRPALSLHETAELLRDPRVTTAVLTPAVFALMAEAHLEALGPCAISWSAET